MSSNEELVVEVEDLSKIYGLPFEISWRGIRSVMPKGDVALSRRHLAVKNMTFGVRKGELLGIIGRNGAGKSTLLKVLAGVSPPTRGKIKVRGRIFPMIELNAGMSPTLTGRENVMLLGTILGLDPSDLRDRMDEIEDFCDLGEWFDKPVWQYSSGMPSRLGFAVAVHSEADVLLIDEILAVGDIAFRDRCTHKMLELRESGKTVILVSHNMSAIAGLCTRTIMIETGEIKYDSLPDATVQYYQQYVAGLSRAKLKKKVIEGLEVTTAPDFAVHGVLAVNERQRAVEEVRADKPFSILMDIEKPPEFDEGLVEFIVTAPDGTVCVEERVPVLIEGFPTYRRIELSFVQGLPLRSGNYVVALRLNDDRTGASMITAQKPLTLTRRRTATGLVAPMIHTTISSPQPGRPGLAPLKVDVSAPRQGAE
jgi:ABC-type polysaccharide/polyol phosphate transport system ATPase subunit